jgi:hypothetical protein
MNNTSSYEQRGKVEYAQQQLKRLRQQFIARTGIFQHLNDKSAYQIMMQQLSDIYYRDLKNDT